MERSGSAGLRIGLTVALGLAGFLPGAHAGVILLPPMHPGGDAAEASENEAAYPESRFGHAPPKTDAGRGVTYAAKEAESLDGDLDDTDTAGGTTGGAKFRGRAPASMTFSKGGENGGLAKRRSELAPRVSVIEPGPGLAEVTGLDSGPGAGEIARKGVQEVAVIAGDLGFFPRTVFVSRDVPVRLFVTGASKNALCIMMDSFQVRRQIRSQRVEEITFTPSVPGKYRFYCPVNGSEGTMIVRELASGN